MTHATQAPTVDTKLEMVVIPVSDVDRAKGFYGSSVGGSTRNSPTARLSASSSSPRPARPPRSFRQGRDPGGARLRPGALPHRLRRRGRPRRAARPWRRDQRSVPRRRRRLCRHGRTLSVRHARASGPDPDQRSYRSFASFKDPDGNGWLFQEVTTRLPGRVDTNETLRFRRRPRRRAAAGFDRSWRA